MAIATALAAVRGLGLLGPDGSAGMLGVFIDVLISVNLVLAAFNLIPAFPMDGGRVLRALLSGWVGRGRATMIAAGIGRGLALAFGTYRLIQGEMLHVLLAGFIYFVAGQELARVLAEEQTERPRGRWRSEGATDSASASAPSDGIWTAPSGFRWVSRGEGVWQLDPIVVNAQTAGAERVPSSWR